MLYENSAEKLEDTMLQVVRDQLGAELKFTNASCRVQQSCLISPGS
jgi:Fe-S cluster assembly iron-binding protein IscA